MTNNKSPSTNTIVTSCQLENGKVVITFGVPGSCEHALWFSIPTPERMQEKCRQNTLNSAMMFLQTLYLGKITKCEIPTCIIHILDRKSYTKLFSAAWAVADKEVKEKFTELHDNVEK